MQKSQTHVPTLNGSNVNKKIQIKLIFDSPSAARRTSVATTIYNIQKLTQRCNKSELLQKVIKKSALNEN